MGYGRYEINGKYYTITIKSTEEKIDGIQIGIAK